MTATAIALTTRPQPQPLPLSVVAGAALALSPAAQKALATDPREIVARWLASISEGSRRIYARALAGFTAWAVPTAQDPHGLRVLTEAGAGGAHELLVAWRDTLLARGLSPATTASSVSAICSLLKVAKRAGVVPFTVDGVAPKRERVQDRSGPSRGQVERLLAFVDEAAERGEQQAVRDAAVIRCLHNCALRRAEVAGLLLQHVQLDHADGPRVLALRKGHRTRQPVSISEMTAKALVAWLQLRGPEEGAVFHRLDRASDRQPLTGEAVRALLASWARKAGLRVPCRPHGLRHSVASQIAKHGSLDELQAIGGWRSLSSAAGYLDRRDETRRRALALVDI